MGKYKGFTLIELLVVIAIIVLLFAILMPSLNKARNQARNIVCQSNLKQWGTVLMLYTDDNEGWLPSDHNKGAWLLGGPNLNAGDDNVSPIYHNLPTKEIGLCPKAKKATTSHETISWSFNGEKVKAKPGSKDSAWIMKLPLSGILGSYGFSQGIFDNKNGINVDQVNNRYKTPVFLDCGMPYGSINGQIAMNGYSYVFTLEPQPTENYMGSTFCINRHEGFVNCLYLDWSIRKVGLKELWTLKWYEDFDTTNEMTLAGGVQPEDWPKWMRKYKDY